MPSKLSELKSRSPLPAEKFEFLAGELLNFSPEKMFLLADSVELSQKQVNKIKKLEGLMAGGTPPQYIFKKAYFRNLKFFVDTNVLIPRPETEILVAEAIKFLEHRIENTGYREHKLRILDLGTGSGCIAITVKKLFPQANITAVDYSREALNIAKKNATFHKTEIHFLRSNLFGKVVDKYDLILANLPYGDPTDPDYQKVADPKIATNGGKNGFELIEKTIEDLPNHLLPKGQAIFEIGHNQKKLIVEATSRNGLKITVIKDLNNFDRIALIN